MDSRKLFWQIRGLSCVNSTTVYFIHGYNLGLQAFSRSDYKYLYEGLMNGRLLQCLKLGETLHDLDTPENPEKVISSLWLSVMDLKVHVFLTLYLLWIFSAWCYILWNLKILFYLPAFTFITLICLWHNNQKQWL